MSKWVMMGTWAWFTGVLLSSFMTGTFIGSTQQAVLNYLQLFTIWHIGSWSFPVINLGFFNGLWSIMQTGNFQFLTGNPLFIIVYLLNIGIIVGFFTLFSSMVSGFFIRR